jgi:hypothetical protein
MRRTVKMDGEHRCMMIRVDRLAIPKNDVGVLRNVAMEFALNRRVNRLMTPTGWFSVG